MAEKGIFERLDALFTERIEESTFVSRGHTDVDEVRVIELVGGIKLECARGEEGTFWFEVIFPVGGSMRVERGIEIPASEAETLGYVLRENNA